MQIFLQYPALTALLALAAVPLLVHLLSRARPPEYRFPNVEFLRRVMRRTARIRKPKDWLLLLLRTLAMTAIAAAFVGPLLVSENAALPGEKVTTLVMIDRSASMAAREGAGNRFDIACAQAAEFLEKSHPSSANLIWIDAEPDAAFPEPGPNLAYLTDLIKQASPRPEAGSLTAAFDLALRQLTAVQGRRELVVISDFQASAWKDFSPALPPDVKLVTHRVATSAPANVAVTRLLAQPAQPVAGQDTTMLASVRNFSPDSVRSQITLDAGGSRQSQSIELPPWSEIETAFSLRPASAGPLPVTASVDADAFPGDDSRHAVMRVRDAIRVESSHSKGKIISKVVSSLPWLEASDHPGPGDIRVLSSWTDSKALRAEADSGITILIHDAADVLSENFAGLFDKTFQGSATFEASPAGWQILPDETHPAVQLFRSGDFGNPFAGTFRERLRMANDLSGIRKIATYADAVPAIFEIPTRGAPIVFLNLSLDATKSDWATQGGFLPALGEILLRTRPKSIDESTQSLPGALLSRVSNDAGQSGAIKLLGPDGKALPLQESAAADGLVWQATEPAVPGLYRWDLSGQMIDLTAVNFPDSESDLRALDAAPAFGNRATATNSLARRAAMSQGIPLWPWLLAAGLAFLLLENLVQVRHARPLPA